jgi:hypothetical protein
VLATWRSAECSRDRQITRQANHAGKPFGHARAAVQRHYPPCENPASTICSLGMPRSFATDQARSAPSELRMPVSSQRLGD